MQWMALYYYRFTISMALSRWWREACRLTDFGQELQGMLDLSDLQADDGHLQAHLCTIRSECVRRVGNSAL